MFNEFADPDRPKNDKASILTDAIQMVKELTAQIDKLKAEHAALNEESREVIVLATHPLFSPFFSSPRGPVRTVLLSTSISQQLTQEKNDLREEKASLKSDIESLNGQYQQRVRAMSPCP